MTDVVEAPAATRAVPEAPGAAPAPPEPRRRGRWSASTRVLVAAAVLVVAQLLVRGWVALGGALSQDDLVVAGRSARQPLLSAEFLFPADDRFAPLADLLTAGLTRLAPLEYWPMAAALVLLQGLASLAVLRLLRLLLGTRPVLLLPLVLYLFSPLALAAFDDWSIAVGAVPFQAALAWICGDAIALHRTGRRTRYAVSGAVVLAVGLGFGEQAVVIPAVAFVVLALVLRQSGDTSPLVAALRRGLWLWVGLGAVLTAFVWRFGAGGAAPDRPRRPGGHGDHRPSTPWARASPTGSCPVSSAVPSSGPTSAPGPIRRPRSCWPRRSPPSSPSAGPRGGGRAAA